MKIVIIFLLACGLRLWFVSEGNVMFWFDQARDAVVVTSMVEQKDLKLQGPTASGTGDAIFHGVLYYYFLAPLYEFSDGNPQSVANFLAIFSSLSIFVIYAVIKDVTRNKNLALLVSLLAAVSAVHVQESVWLSNPVLLLILMPLFFWSLWKVFFSGQKKMLPAVALLLGLSNQSALFTVYLFGPILLSYFYLSIAEKKWKVFSVRQILASLVVYFLTIFTMVLTEILMFKRGVLTLSSLLSLEAGGKDGAALVIQILKVYFNFWLRLLNPNLILLFFIPLAVISYFGYRKSTHKIKIFLLICLSSVLWLISLQFREPHHLFIGMEILVYFALAVGFIESYKQWWGKIIVPVLLFLFIILNISLLIYNKNNQIHFLGLQKGTMLSDQMRLIEKTYDVADKKLFSISSLTSPYGVNVTWAYLYHQFGQKKHGYMPHFFGPTQVGLVGENYLLESPGALPLHFTIVEPDVYLGPGMNQQFLLDQDSLSRLMNTKYEFGSLELQQR